ncbi:MAG: DUF4491 family protein [Treponema sp.]|jgi:hypothetical protein|nr:DUF4491 family protein [Treponema sp.]
MCFDGLITGVIVFVVIGVFHPITIKCEYYFSENIWPVFLAAGFVTAGLSCIVSQPIISASLAVLGCTFFWSIIELKHQTKRVEKGWFPKNPQRGVSINEADNGISSEKKTPKPVAFAETCFDGIYLGVVFFSGLLLCAKGDPGGEKWLFGLTALVLGAGDAFHLIPRIVSRNSGADYTAALGVGKFITSITMTVFYMLLWNIGRIHYPGFEFAAFRVPVLIFAAVRVALCLFPQNRWASKTPSGNWAVWRNIPFVLLGFSVMAMYAAGSRIQPDGLSPVWVAVLISFVCYIPVVLFSGKYPRIAMLMLPKTCAYAAIVLLGFSLS